MTPKDRVTYKIQVWEVKKEGFASNDLKNSLTFEVSPDVANEAQFLQTWRQNIVVNYNCNDFYIPELKEKGPWQTQLINRVNIKGSGLSSS
jgi:hypothetical protein